MCGNFIYQIGSFLKIVCLDFGLLKLSRGMVLKAPLGVAREERSNQPFSWSLVRSFIWSHVLISEVVGKLFMLTLLYSVSHAALVTNTIML
jgi:hypothetical protein